MSDNDWSSVPEIARDKLALTEVREVRVNICRGCENLTSLHFCKICNCFMPLKTYMKSQKCPIDKW